MSDAYGFLAPIYQPLSKFIFGDDLVAANSVFSALSRGKRSLIIGGGDAVAYRDWDGNYLGEYWDTSYKMSVLARQNLLQSKVRIHCGSWPGTGKFDVVVLPFVLDTMSDPDITKLIGKIADSLNPAGKVILSDFFSTTAFSQRLLQALMITGFRVFVQHSRANLPNIGDFFSSDSWELLEENIWKGGWIRAQVYRKRESLSN